MVSDDPIVYASGDDWGTVNIGTGTTLTDDEDLYDYDYVSGSGSGDREDDVNLGIGPGKPVVDIEIPDGGTGIRKFGKCPKISNTLFCTFYAFVS